MNLKIAFFIVAALAPVIIVLLVIRYNRIIKQVKNNQQANQKLIEKRIEFYDRIGPKLNDLLCFYSYTGNWKELTPFDILRLKKELDKEIHVHAPLFSDDLGEKYLDFMRVCFVSYSGWEHKEQIKSLYEIRKEHMAAWIDEWIPFFDTKNVVEAIRLKERYDELMACFKRDLNP